MYQRYFTIKRESSFYEFDLDKKTCQIDVELFQEILKINLRVSNQEFTEPPSNDSLFDFILELGYKVNWNTFQKCSQRSEDMRSSPIPVDKDGVLDRLKFISKGEIRQVYGKSIPAMLITDDIQNNEAYKMFISLSTGLSPPKIGRGKGAQGSKATVTPKKAIAASNKKKAKKIESSDEE
nr:hypothetical protein [Tanacetum cinerariifolium]